MDNSMKYGYKFKIIKGYTFNKGRPFKNIIDDLYKLRLEYPKSDPMIYIAKLFMNSLYGRFGMNDNFNEIRIVNENSLNDLINNKTLSIQDIYNNVYYFIDSLSQTQKLAVIHISMSITILFCLFTLIGVFYGERILNYFNLEQKYPKLAGIIKLRRRFQQFYFLWNSFMILLVLALIISFNLYILFNS